MMNTAKQCYYMPLPNLLDLTGPAYRAAFERVQSRFIVGSGVALNMRRCCWLSETSEPGLSNQESGMLEFFQACTNAAILPITRLRNQQAKPTYRATAIPGQDGVRRFFSTKGEGMSEFGMNEQTDLAEF